VLFRQRNKRAFEPIAERFITSSFSAEMFPEELSAQFF